MAACKKTSLKEQIIRGLIGAALLGVAFYFMRTNAVIAFFFVLLSIIPLRGCPTCWGFYMFEALANARKDKAKSAKNPAVSEEET